MIQITKDADLKPITPEEKDKADLARTQVIMHFVNPQKETMDYVVTA